MEIAAAILAMPHKVEIVHILYPTISPETYSWHVHQEVWRSTAYNGKVLGTDQMSSNRRRNTEVVAMEILNCSGNERTISI